MNQNLLKSLVHYDPETGVMTWLPRKEKFWNAQHAGKALSYVNDSGYMEVCITINKIQRYYFLHRLAWLYIYGEFPNGPLDHINRIKSDNRITNLRVADATKNGHNVKSYSTNKSGVKGVSWSKAAKKWRAVLVFNKKYMHLGVFDTIDDAEAAYIAASLSFANEFSVHSTVAKDLQ